jgi:hypothetical protein
MVGTRPATCPARPCGAGEHLLRPMLPATRPAPWPWTSAHVGPLGPRRRRSRDAGQAAALGYGQPSYEPCTANGAPSPARQARAGRRPRRPRGHVDPLRPPPGAARHTEHSRVQRGADSAAAAPRTPEACPSGHLDAPDAWTPDAWTPDVRSTGDADRATTGPAGVRTSSRPVTTRWVARSRPVTAPGALGHPGRLRGDSTCAAALLPPPPDSCPTPPGIRPRHGALLSSDEFRVERRANGDASSVMAVARMAGCGDGRGWEQYMARQLRTQAATGFEER